MIDRSDVKSLHIVRDNEVIEQAELGIDGGEVVSIAQDADGVVYVLDLADRMQRIEPGDAEFWRR